MKSYKESGVDINEGYKTVKKIKPLAEKTHNENVINSLGSFAAMYEIKNYNNPVLISGTDGVGTKLDIAFRMNRFDTVGIDCVAMCVNDILCHGAKPLFFLDYLACGKLSSDIASEIVSGIAEGCLMSGAALIGGETAEMPGFYDAGKYDIAGFSVGIAEKEEIIDGKKIKAGDILIGIESSGLHSNGFSLVRSLISDFNEKFGEKTIGEELLTPTKIYVKPVLDLIKKVEIKGMAHITGGGFYENIPRMFADKNLKPVINKNSYEIPEIFRYLMKLGVSEEDMYHTFNMGIGFVLCTAEENSEKVNEILREYGLKSYKIGYVSIGGNELCLE